MLVAGALVMLAVGAGAALAAARLVDRRAQRLERVLRDDLRSLASEQREEVERGRDATLQAAIDQLATVQRSLVASDRELNAKELSGQRALIDRQLGDVRSELERVGELVRGLERDRAAKFGELTNELARQREGVAALTETAGQLREVLASQKARGQWGERMAEDVLALAGFVEGVSYRRQRTLDHGSGRPDYTFLLPNDLLLHMDVKFPLDSYVRFLDASSELEARQHRDQFLRDVRDRVNELAARGYLDGRESVDCLLMFIPNEAVYAFVQQHAPEILDDALRHSIVVCSPLTLYAVLAVVRQAVDHFRIEQTSAEILGLLGEFSKQWDKFVDALESQEQRFDKVAREFSTLTGTRRRAVERPLDKIEALRASCAPEEPTAAALDWPAGSVTPLAAER